MSATIMGQVWDLALPTNEQAVLLAMADHADHSGGNVFPSTALIAWKIGRSKSTVRRVRQKLERRGILVLVEAKQGCVKHYQIDLTKGPQKPPYVPSGEEAPPPKAMEPLPICDPCQSSARGTPPKSDTTPSQSYASGPLPELCYPNHQLTSITVREPKKKSKGTSTSISLHRLFSDGFCKRYEARNGGKYQFSGSKDGPALARLVKLDTPENLLAVLDEAMGKTDGQKYWNCVHQTSTISAFAGALNKIRAELSNGKPRSYEGRGF
jgi:hypothetical protein